VLLNFLIGRFVLGSLCAGDLVRVGLSLSVLQAAVHLNLIPFAQ